MKRVINSFFPEKCANVIHHIFAQTYFSFTRFIGGQLTEAIILGALCYIGMLIFGFPNAAIISIIICITALVPVVGALVGAIIGAFLILITDPIKAILFVVFLVILQQLEGNRGFGGLHQQYRYGDHYGWYGNHGAYRCSENGLCRGLLQRGRCLR